MSFKRIIWYRVHFITRFFYSISHFNRFVTNKSSIDDCFDEILRTPLSEPFIKEILWASCVDYFQKVVVHKFCKVQVAICFIAAIHQLDFYFSTFFSDLRIEGSIFYWLFHHTSRNKKLDKTWPTWSFLRNPPHGHGFMHKYLCIRNVSFHPLWMDHLSSHSNNYLRFVSEQKLLFQQYKNVMDAKSEKLPTSPRSSGVYVTSVRRSIGLSTGEYKVCDGKGVLWRLRVWRVFQFLRSWSSGMWLQIYRHFSL